MPDYNRHPDLIEEIRKMQRRLDNLERPKPQQNRYWEDATEETTTSTSYVSLGDEVTVTLPTKGLIAVGYHAAWRAETGTASAGLFINDTHLRVTNESGGAPAASATGSASSTWTPLLSVPYGIQTYAVVSDYTGPVTIGQALGFYYVANPGLSLGGVCYIFAAAGTYTVGPRFKNSTGGITAVKMRSLWAWTQAAPATVS